MRSLADLQSNETEVELSIQQYQSGNDDSFVFIYRNYSGLTKAIANSYFLKGADKQDLIQEGFIGLYKAARDYRKSFNVPFKYFAEMCVRRQIITAIKASTRQKHEPLNYYKSFNQPIGFIKESATLENTISSGALNPENVIIENENISELNNLINDCLSPFEKSVFTLYKKGYSYKEIALSLDVNCKRVDTAIWRSKRKIKSFTKI